MQPYSAYKSLKTNPVVVFGGGAAGMSTAISAARQGLPVILVENDNRLGGTVVKSFIHTLGALYDDTGNFINRGLPVELAQRLLDADPRTHKRRIGRTWTLSVEPAVYDEVTRSWLLEEGLIAVLLRHSLVSGTVERDSVMRLDLKGPSSIDTIRPLAVVDATGSAEVVRQLAPDHIVDDPHRAAAGLICRLRHVEPGALEFPRNVEVLRTIRQAAAKGTLPAECMHAWLDMGCLEDEIYLKLFVPLRSRGGDELAKRERETQRTRDALLAHLQNLPEFATAHISATGELGIRDDGGILGEYILTKSDISSGQKFTDAACRCSWPIEYWDPVEGAKLEYLSPGTCYEIPLRSLRVRDKRNLWAVGKCLSADRYARASARCVGTCWAMGDAVGKAI